MTLFRYIFSFSALLLFFKQSLLLVNNGISIIDMLAVLQKQSKLFFKFVKDVNYSFQNGVNIINSYQSLLLKNSFLGCTFQSDLPNFSLWLELYSSFLFSLQHHVIRLLKSLIYPFFLFLFSLGLFFFLLFFIIPRVVTQYDLYQITLPFIVFFLNQFTLILSDFFIPISILMMIICLLFGKLFFKFIITYFIRPFLLLELYWAFYILSSQGLDLKRIIMSISFSDKHLLFFDYERFKKEFFMTSSFSTAFITYLCDHPLIKVIINHSKEHVGYSSLFKDVISIYENYFLSKIDRFLVVFKVLMLCIVAGLILFIFWICFFPLIHMMESLI